ncbi:MAG: PEGA domain-containing protein [Deltaproteobacteria bacterium]|nr:PEGA domain-containing protein [Deltaproteobacteria bacterium]
MLLALAFALLGQAATPPAAPPAETPPAAAPPPAAPPPAAPPPAAPVTESPPAAAPPSDAPPTAPAPAASPLPPPTKPRLLAMDVVDKGAGLEVTNAINQAVQGQAVESHLGETITATQIKLLLDASANQQMLGCDAELCMASVGKLVEASIILGGNVAKVGEDFLITVLVVNPRDGTRVAQQQRKVPANRELYYYAAKQLTSLALTGRAVDPRVPVIIGLKDGDAATIVVDGEDRGQAPSLTVHLDPGQHEIRVRQSGKAEWKTVISVEDATPMQVLADPVDARISLWPAAVATGVGTIVVTGAALMSGLVAEDVYAGTIDLPLYDTTPDTSYSKPEPIDSLTLFQREQDVKLASAIANGLYVTGALLGVVTIALVTTDVVLAASAE